MGTKARESDEARVLHGKVAGWSPLSGALRMQALSVDVCVLQIVQRASQPLEAACYGSSNTTYYLCSALHAHQLQVLARYLPGRQVAVNEVDGEEQRLRHQLQQVQGAGCIVRRSDEALVQCDGCAAWIVLHL